MVRAYKIEFVVAIGVLCLGSALWAGVEDDFKDASNRDGCEAIPYSSERGTCISAGRDVDDWCKNPSKPWSCDDLDPTGLNHNIDNVTGKINDLKREKDDLEYKRNNSQDESERRELESKIKEKREMIETLQAKIDGWKKQIDTERGLARDRQDIGERCVASRVMVQKLFATVKVKVQGESDPGAKQYVSKLTDKYTAAEKGHQDAIDITNRGIDKCKGKR
jgi:hypothetical protein